MESLISVIVPIYKVEKYLDRCVRSIVNQTYKNLEIILVDDGSPDNCPRMCDEWAEIDTRIKVIHLENGGAGRARNIGLKSCKGQFVSFVDSDDLLDISFYKTLIGFFDDNVDIVECEYITFEGSNHIFSNNQNNSVVLDAEQALGCHIKESMFKQVIWNKLYRKELIQEIEFPEGKLIDDEYWTYRVIGEARQLVHIFSVLYAYRQQPNSVMHKKYSFDRLQGLEAKANRLMYIKEKYPKLYNDARFELYGSCMFAYQSVLKFLKGEEKHLALSQIKKYKQRCDLSLSEIMKKQDTSKKYYLFSKISFYLCCKFRAVANIGF